MENKIVAGRGGRLTIEKSHLAFDPADEAPIHGLLGYSITYRIATGPREGQKVFTLKTLPADPDRSRWSIAERSGFSPHARVQAKDSERDKLERPARYVSRPPLASERLEDGEGGPVKYQIVGEDKADPAAGTISYVSPLGQALMGREVGDEVGVGERVWEVVEIG